GPVVLSILQWWLWLALLALWIFAFFKGGARHVGALFLLLGLLVAGVCLLAGVGEVTGTAMGALLGASSGILSTPAWMLWGLAAAPAGLGIAFLAGAWLPWLGKLAVVALVVAMAGILAFGAARAQGLSIPWVPDALNHIPGWFLWFSFGLVTALAALLYGIRKQPGLPTKTVFALLAAGPVAGCVAFNGFLGGGFGGITVGPIPKGVPVSLVMNI